MKKLFQAVRQNDLAAVRELLEKKPELIACAAKQPPKKDDGAFPVAVNKFHKPCTLPDAEGKVLPELV